jgi:hypothetical protein
MAEHHIPNVEYLRNLLRYEPDTGKVFWRERGPEMYLHCRDPQGYAKRFNARCAGTELGGGKAKAKYRIAHIGVDGRQYNVMLHRVVWCLHYGEWPKYSIDHIDGDPSNNRIANLRDVPMAENLRNRRRMKNNTSGANGVQWSPRLKLWKALAHIGGKTCYLGSYPDKDAAEHAAYIARKALGFSERHGKL